MAHNFLGIHHLPGHSSNIIQLIFQQIVSFCWWNHLSFPITLCPLKISKCWKGTFIHFCNLTGYSACYIGNTVTRSLLSINPQTNGDHFQNDTGENQRSQRWWPVRTHWSPSLWLQEAQLWVQNTPRTPEGPDSTPSGPPKQGISPYKSMGILRVQMMVNSNPLIRPYFLGGVGIGGVPPTLGPCQW